MTEKYYPLARGKCPEEKELLRLSCQVSCPVWLLELQLNELPNLSLRG